MASKQYTAIALNSNESIQNILNYLFQYQHTNQKKQDYPSIYAQFEHLDMAAQYVLFSLIEKQLPRRARLLFVGETYQGKQEAVYEVLAHVAGRSLTTAET